MFDATDFHPEHLADLRKSGLSDATIAQAGLKSVRPADIRKVTAIDKVQSRDCLANGQKTTLTILKPSVTHPLLVA
jgi:hypothetical protein